MRAELGEGTLWDPVGEVLWWVDIWGKAIHRYDPATGRDDVFPTPEYVGCVGLRESGRAGGDASPAASISSIRRPASSRRSSIPKPERPDTRFNDGKPDRQGRFWSGTVFEDPPRPTEFVGALYRLDPTSPATAWSTASARRTASPSAPTAAPCISPTARAAFVWAWDFDPATGDIDRRRVFIDFRDDRRLRRRRDGRCRGLLLDDAARDRQGLRATIPTVG